MNSYTEYIQNEEHYNKVLSLVPKVEKSIWIGTADIKDLYYKQAGTVVPFLSILAKQINRGVAIRLIHAKEPGKNFKDDFDKYPVLWKNLERMLCPRVHFKLLILDNKIAYIGSANLTGAGLGMKSMNSRNFEAGILTSDPVLVNQALTQFDNVWIGIACKKCLRKEYCGDRIV